MNVSAIKHFSSFLRDKVPSDAWDFSRVSGIMDPDRVRQLGHEPHDYQENEEALIHMLFSLFERKCGAVGCAVGWMPVAFSMTKEEAAGFDFREASNILDIPYHDADHLFGGSSTFVSGVYGEGKEYSDVKAHHVADALDRYVERNGERWWKCKPITDYGNDADHC